MIVNIKLEITDVLQLIASFGKDTALALTIETQRRGEAVIEKIANQLDQIVAGLEADSERRKP